MSTVSFQKYLTSAATTILLNPAPEAVALSLRNIRQRNHRAIRKNQSALQTVYLFQSDGGGSITPALFSLVWPEPGDHNLRVLLDDVVLDLLF